MLLQCKHAFVYSFESGMRCTTGVAFKSRRCTPIPRLCCAEKVVTRRGYASPVVNYLSRTFITLSNLASSAVVPLRSLQERIDRSMHQALHPNAKLSERNYSLYTLPSVLGDADRLSVGTFT